MNVSRAFISLLIALPWAATAVAAPAETWEAVGPWGGGASLLAPVPGAPDNLYATTVTGAIFFTADHGLHWRLVSDQLLGDFIRDLVVDPRDPAVLYATTVLQPGVLKSVDGGASWTLRAGVDGRMVLPAALAVDPSDSQVVFVATFRGPYRSTDAGNSWTPAGSALTGQLPRALLVDAAHAGTVLAGTASGVWKSGDRGTTWAAASRGIQAQQGILALAADPSSPGTLYAATDIGQIYRSDDLAESWIPVARVSVPFNGNAYLLLVVAGDGSIYALRGGTLARSTDRGATFSPLPLPDHATTNFTTWLVADPVSPRRLVAAAASGPLASEDGGASWHPASRGFTARGVGALAVGAGEPPVLWASVGAGGVKTRLPASRWPFANGDLPPADLVAAALAADPLDRSRIWRTTPSGVARSDDLGRHWSELPIPDQCATFRGIAIDPLRPRTLYVAGTILSSLCDSHDAHSWKSVDGGRHWLPLPIGASSITVDPRHPAVLYGLIPSGNAVLRSEDGGASWRNVTPAARLVFPNALAIDPVHTSNLLLAADQGLWRSTDRGATWHPIGAGALPAGHAVGVAVDPRTPRILYAAIAGAGIFSSPDAGATWSPLGTGLPALYLAHLLLDPTDPQHLYALTTAYGIFRLTLPPPGR
jgi:photosystem II stability/assembly factor-like uncharacterized protein